MIIHGIEIDDFVRGYANCALFTGTDESDESGGEPLDKNYGMNDFTKETFERFIKDCDSFREKAGDDLKVVIGTRVNSILYLDEWAGHDFWLTRNGHGAGFWDRNFDEALGDRLSEIAREFGEAYVFVTDDGKLVSE